MESTTLTALTVDPSGYAGSLPAFPALRELNTEPGTAWSGPERPLVPTGGVLPGRLRPETGALRLLAPVPVGPASGSMPVGHLPVDHLSSAQAAGIALSGRVDATSDPTGTPVLGSTPRDTAG